MLRIAGQLWRPAGGSVPRARILAVHGTQDNCASFEPLAPLLAAAGYCIFAMDLTGHGRSDWRPGGFYHRTGWVLEIMQTLAALGSDWVSQEQPLVLMGHSLGAALCSLAAGAFPESFSAVIFIDGLGWWGARTPEEMAELAKSRGYAGRAYEGAGPDFYKPFSRMRRAVDGVLTLDGKTAQGKKVYKSLDAAVDARIQATESSPIGQRLSQPAALAIVRRGIRDLPGVGVAFTHDSRITASTRSSAMLDDDAVSFLERVPSALLLHGDPAHTWPGIHERSAARLPRLDAARVEVRYFPGEAHHLHADSPGLVLPAILRFLAGLRPSASPPMVAARL